ncbi:MAG: hypothetical protein Q9219_001622 [cf. Caloplaca sp. 3 TL-2023]
MSEKSDPEYFSLVSREKRSTPFGKTIFVGLRAADAVLQYHLLRQGWASDAVRTLGGNAVPTIGAGPLGLTPYGAIVTFLAAGSSFKHGLWQVAISEQEMSAPAAIAICAFNTLLNTANTLFSVWTLSSAAPTNLPPAASVGDVLLSSPSLAVGVALFGVGITTELYAEFQRKAFKSRPENKGKPYGGGLWSLARHFNYGAYNLWRGGYALATGGPIWGLAIAGFFFYDFTQRAIPELDQYCTKRICSHRAIHVFQPTMPPQAPSFPTHRITSQIRRFRTKPRLLHPRSKPTPPSPPSPPPQQENDDYYSLLLAQPLAAKSPTSFSPPSVPHPSPPKEPRRDPSILFGTPLAGPSAARRRAGYGEEGSATAGDGLERPREPDNCCMSGCVNCVWDAYREEVEAWAVRRREAARQLGGEEDVERRKAREMRGKGRRIPGVDGGGVVGDMDEVGRGVDVDNEAGLFEGVPVGIREFMATEKRLREKRERDEKGAR